MSDTPPLVSVAIPCFNAARWLREAIQSALDQDWPNVEVIVFDDGSTDESPQIISAFGSQIRSERGRNQGGNFARNALLRAARGEWIQFLDADDYLLPGKLSTQLAEADMGTDCDLVLSSVWKEDYSRGMERSELPGHESHDADPARHVLAPDSVQTGGMLWRREALERIGGWNEECDLGQETELYCRAVISDLRIRWTPSINVVYRYRWSGQSVSTVPAERHCIAKLRFVLMLVPWLKKHGQWDSFRENFAAKCFHFLRMAAGFDLRIAGRLEAKLRQSGLWATGDVGRRHWAGPRYSLTYRWLGFQVAESLGRHFGTHTER